MVLLIRSSSVLLPPPKALPVVLVRVARSAQARDSVSTPMLALTMKSNGMCALLDGPVGLLWTKNWLKSAIGSTYQGICLIKKLIKTYRLGRHSGNDLDVSMLLTAKSDIRQPCASLPMALRFQTN
ncbi:MAG: hypothetical protein ACKOUT_08105 [Novosphingobium sp.]